MLPRWKTKLQSIPLTKRIEWLAGCFAKLFFKKQKGGFHMSKSQKDIPLAPEETKHKKKSKSKGEPRSKHKHEYKTVLVHHEYDLTKSHDPNPWHISNDKPTKVCVICGRIAECDLEYYETKDGGVVGKIPLFVKELKEEAYQLEKWELRQPQGKYATKLEKNIK